MLINDAHCHFFSTDFFAALIRQSSRLDLPTSSDLCRELGWDDPGTDETLADRWITELDAYGITRAAVIASVPGDEQSVARAVARHPSRLVGFFIVDPSSSDAVERTHRATTEYGLRGVCLFPAMHHVPLDDERVQTVVATAARVHGVTIFVHCGVLSVGVRKKLGLPSHFDLRLGNPLAVARLAQMHPRTPFVIPHFGAGLLRESLMAADASSNIYFDTSSSNSWMRYQPGLTLEAVFASALSVLGPSRLLFGTDSSFFPRGWLRGVYDEQRAALDAQRVSEADQALIFGGNFNRLFG
jgi:predicted TIM-barrel fold metal-dependent hydrolase